MKSNIDLPTAVLWLGKLPLLAGVDKETLGKVAAAVTWREVKKREAVLFKGSSGDHLLFLVEGRLQVLDVTESGREIGLNLLTAGDYFGELSIIDGEPRSASVVAMDNSLVALLPRRSRGSCSGATRWSPSASCWGWRASFATPPSTRPSCACRTRRSGFSRCCSACARSRRAAWW
jgi:hypothetical protein